MLCLEERPFDPQLEGNFEPHLSRSSSSASASDQPAVLACTPTTEGKHQPREQRGGNKQAEHGGLGMYRLGLEQIHWLCVVWLGRAGKSEHRFNSAGGRESEGEASDSISLEGVECGYNKLDPG